MDQYLEHIKDQTTFIFAHGYKFAHNQKIKLAEPFEPDPLVTRGFISTEDSFKKLRKKIAGLQTEELLDQIIKQQKNNQSHWLEGRMRMVKKIEEGKQNEEESKT